jgi:hypothetical protein
MAVDLIGPVLTSYVDQAALAVSPGVAKLIHVNPGALVPWDDCCGGQIAARVISVGPQIGQQSAGTMLPCGVLAWIATVGLGIIRCVAVVREDGQGKVQIPDGPTMDADGQQMLNDMAALQQVVLCHPATRSIQGWTPVGAEGGCAGGEWVFTTRVASCACPESAHG